MMERMEQNASVCIIIPVYNAAPFLARCVSSILSQSFPAFDMILVDDGSTDSSGELCDSYSESDSRIHVIHQENAGPSAARNAGLDWAFRNSASSYLTFVDSDDCLHPQYLELLFRAIGDADLCACRHQYISLGNSLPPAQQYSDLHPVSLSAEDYLLRATDSFNYAWAKLFKIDCFRNVRYPLDVSFGEDNLVIYKVLFDANQIRFIDERLYYYFFNPTGITKSPWNPKSLAVFDGIRQQLDFYQTHGFQRAYQKELELYAQQYAYQIHRISENRESQRQYKSILASMRSELRSLISRSPSLNMNDNPYWYEALYPQTARAKRNFRKLCKLIRSYIGKENERGSST